MSDTATPSIVKTVATTHKFLQQLEGAGLTDDDIRRIAGSSERAKLWVQALRELPARTTYEVPPPLIEREVPEFPSAVGVSELIDYLDLSLSPEEKKYLAGLMVRQGWLRERFAFIDGPTNNMRQINAQARTMIILRFGLIDGEKLSYSAVAKQIGRSPATVRDRLRGARWPLRQSLPELR